MDYAVTDHGDAAPFSYTPTPTAADRHDYAELPPLRYLAIAPHSVQASIGKPWRLLAQVASTDAAQHIEQTVLIDLVWIAAADDIADPDFAAIMAAAARRGCGLICETSVAGLDRLAALVPDSMPVEWLIDADPTERSLAFASMRMGRSAHVNDRDSDAALERIERLQEEVDRISRLLGELVNRREQSPFAAPSRSDASDGAPDQVRSPVRSFAVRDMAALVDGQPGPRERAKQVRNILRQRRMREQFFPAELFADPAWDMLLDLYAAHLERQPVSVSSLCIAAAVPATTALRWIKTMTESGLLIRQDDPQDGRRIFIALGEQAADAMAGYFDALDE